MRTNIDIDDDLMAKAMAATETTTKKAAVEASLRLAVRNNEQQSLKDLFGTVVWRGHDDDWFASDEEILRLRKLARESAELNQQQTRDPSTVCSGNGSSDR